MLKLDKTPNKPTVIEGFPGVGLVASIVTEYLIEHLNAKLIGKIILENMPPIVAIHNREIVQPFGIFYSENKNILLIHGLTMAKGFEWDLSDNIIELCNKTNTQHMISIEGVPARTQSPKTYFYTTSKKYKKNLEELGAKPLENGIVLGVTSSLLIKNEKVPQTCLFVETHMGLPDSKSAALIVKDLNKILELNVDVKPLINKAQEFEKKLKKILSSAKNASDVKRQKEMNYVG